MQAQVYQVWLYNWCSQFMVYSNPELHFISEEKNPLYLCTEKLNPSLNLNWSLTRWLKGLPNINTVKVLTPIVLFYFWKNRKCSPRNKTKEWNKYNGLLRASLFSSATSLLSISYVHQGLKYYNSCHSLDSTLIPKTTHASSDPHPKEKLGKIESI